MTMADIQWEIEPEEVTAGSESEFVDAILDPPPPNEALRTLAHTQPIAGILPAGFNLASILQFLPNVADKQQLETVAATALAVTVTGDTGIAAADTALAKVRECLASILEKFDGTKDNPGPTNLANQLHKRLTGLRGDFTKAGTDAIETVAARIVSETRRLKAVAEAQRLKDQAAADALARQTAARAAEQATQAQADPTIIQSLQAAAKTAVAPPVATRGPATPASSTITEKWRTRFTADASDNTHPETAAMTPEQQASFLIVLRAVLDGKAPLALAQLDWAYADKRAGADKAAFSIPGLVAQDEGGLRSKPRGSR